MLRNIDIRNAIKESNLKYWMVSEFIPLADSSFSRWLRYELDSEQKEKVYSAIEKAKKVYGK